MSNLPVFPLKTVEPYLFKTGDTKWSRLNRKNAGSVTVRVWYMEMEKLTYNLLEQSIGRFPIVAALFAMERAIYIPRSAKHVMHV